MADSGRYILLANQTALLFAISLLRIVKMEGSVDHYMDVRLDIVGKGRGRGMSDQNIVDTIIW